MNTIPINSTLLTADRCYLAFTQLCASFIITNYCMLSAAKQLLLKCSIVYILNVYTQLPDMLLILQHFNTLLILMQGLISARHPSRYNSWFEDLTINVKTNLYVIYITILIGT